jgi:ribosomal protein S18 acetylase RimI-like enzyme
MSEITIRDASIDDLEFVTRANIDLALETESIHLDPDTVLAGVRSLLEDPTKGRYFIAERDGAVVGQLATTFEWSDWRNGMFLWIQSVFVDIGHRRNGVFRALYRHVEELSQRPGYCGVRLYVHLHNDGATATYERLGMVSNDYLVLETPDRLLRGS